jgi:Fic family protein
MLNITPWIEWFLGCLDGAETILAAVLRKAEFWKQHAAADINERQRDILNRLLDGFDGKLTSSRWAAIEKCPPDTALRDIQDLLAQGILVKDNGGGRSTSYSLATGQVEPG